MIVYMVAACSLPRSDQLAALIRGCGRTPAQHAAAASIS
jgi:hypothetical protein